MPPADFSKLDVTRLPTPCFVIDEVAMEHNLAVLQRVSEASGARILLALKAFAMWRLAPLVSKYLSGTCSSGLFEARLGREEFGGEVHVFAVAFSRAELDGVLQIADHVVFNSFPQWRRFRDVTRKAQQARPELRYGLRINPGHSEGAVPIYDPCTPGSRLGIPRAGFEGQSMDGITGLHFHTLCEQGVAPLERTLEIVERTFGHLLAEMEWVNLGGGHLITGRDYAVDDLVRLIREFSNKYRVQVYLEPGAAVAWEAGALITSILDIGWNEMDQVIVDTSVFCHMPDVLEMPYRPGILGAGKPGEFEHDYRIGGSTCMAGDVIGDYSFRKPLVVGDRLVLTDMAHYTMVRTSTFNGVPLPAIALWNSTTDELEIVREFGYENFRARLS